MGGLSLLSTCWGSDPASRIQGAVPRSSHHPCSRQVNLGLQARLIPISFTTLFENLHPSPQDSGGCTKCFGRVRPLEMREV